ncbi:MAG: serine hydroxymethyltransferase [Sulfurimonas sp. RIFCSPHIGHO2_12_FULL_36_9]|uniref:serine hydroxymethyltransferase n=1 Tax=Sulfurimonas sp. RIFCSPLOWO2_12_36_12 TaxID=1802253 RepID=UPI0008CDB5BF|nr:serine hydroxymethyltransferase [Sulfurimonas sp. RIFCSPLOWO2_12_36_12]OHD96499.1 MAG: serine hydroxymethyltransferase [Sulfurimonas sp. RIFCSPHIGHO2_12_FULL_36_9]OHD98342.1 MAG: serine hydroxymethyltransferase [Sulfurimonas sp. RIFCSPLOWO2_02_FULL_36_28]OHE00929.1 MAG: serine hydroxymethyltransferase [Sulfurimonas sp. RIFCSPLOWO2_12_36_12]OHE04185.1 MAG: serine hydroxymethyltransferase [Sulfurimonas sp. RIFCSPLOWO2_12_FULL_36_74]
MSFIHEKSLSSADSEVFEILENEFNRQSTHLEMIASENFTSPAVMEAMGSIFTNKYAEGYPHKRYYGGCQFADQIEQLAIERLCKIFGCSYANVQPHSGSQANGAVYAALLQAGDKLLGMDLQHGGHLTHGAKPSFSGKNYHSFTYGVDIDGRMNYEKISEIAKIVRPKIIVCGASAYAREIDFKKFREIADSVNAILFADIAHIAGLVAAGEHMSPFPYADIVTSTTHKTLRGPRGGVIMTNNEEISKKINSAIFPGLQGGPLVHVIAAKAVAFGEILQPAWSDYAKQVKINAKILGDTLLQRGFKLVSGGTDNHLVLVSLIDKDFSGEEASVALENAGITVNKNSIPGDLRPASSTSGIRIGSAALTTLGMREKEFIFIAHKICDVLDNIKNTHIHAQIKEEVKALLNDFSVYNHATY